MSSHRASRVRPTYTSEETPVTTTRTEETCVVVDFIRAVAAFVGFSSAERCDDVMLEGEQDWLLDGSVYLEGTHLMGGHGD